MENVCKRINKINLINKFVWIVKILGFKIIIFLFFIEVKELIN